ncbi:MAG: hypothetical protein JWN48_4807 [Myxococcaceae bacterium]|nr:hypothetical protein [Myxococcaceae bacterium]
MPLREVFVSNSGHGAAAPLPARLTLRRADRRRPNPPPGDRQTNSPRPARTGYRPRMSSVPSCLRCGACCFSQLDTYVEVTGAAYARLGDAAEQLTVFIGNRCYMRMEDGHCSALTTDASQNFVCSVYEQRPEVCRALPRESPQCEAERALKGERPLLAKLRAAAPLSAA